MPAIEIRRVAPRAYVGVRRKVKHDGLGPLCGEVLPRVAQWLLQRGVTPLGAVLVYHSHDPETGEFDAQASHFVAEAVSGEGYISAGETARGEVLRALHTGPYHTLGATWDAVFAHAQQLKRPVTKSSWEIYLNDPRDTAPNDLQTEIWVPIDAV
jgi:AraC family transcriptional regulator